MVPSLLGVMVGKSRGEYVIYMDQTDSPKVSVLMAVKDGEKYLREAVESILAQTFSDFEFIIIDDGSTDETAQILYGFSDSRLVLLRNEKSLGLTKSLNLGLKLAAGEYIARMDADDLSLPGRLDTQVKYLDAHPKVDVLGTAVTLIDEQGNLVQNTYFPKGHDLITWHLCFSNPIVHPSVMMRRPTILLHHGYDECFSRSQDYDLWWRISFDGKLENLEDIHLLLRKHSLQVSSKDYEEQFENGLKIVQKQASLRIGKTVPMDVFRHLWTKAYSNSYEAVSVSDFLFEYFRTTTKDMENKAQRRLILWDAFRKTREILLPFTSRPKVWCMCLKLIFLRAA
jgi:glycosyltransferase involved in cell wall biosynthesis